MFENVVCEEYLSQVIFCINGMDGTLEYDYKHASEVLICIYIACIKDKPL